MPIMELAIGHQASHHKRQWKACRALNAHAQPSMATSGQSKAVAPKAVSGNACTGNETRLVAGISSFAFQVGGLLLLALGQAPLKTAICVPVCLHLLRLLTPDPLCGPFPKPDLPRRQWRKDGVAALRRGAMRMWWWRSSATLPLLL